MSEHVCVVGLGYMGLPMSLVMSNAGINVTGVDIDQKKIDKINNGECPFVEEGLQELLNKSLAAKLFHATSKIIKANTYIVSVPTPTLIDHKCDLQYVLTACKSILNVVEDGALIIIESTIKPNTCKDIIAPLFSLSNKKVLIAHCPERAIPGNTLTELVKNDRIIGGLTEEASIKAKALYSKFIKGTLYITTATTAECSKLMENTFRDVNIALANEFYDVLDELGVNPWEAISLANKHPRVDILAPGPGVGGHCIAVDPYFLVEDVNCSKIINVARSINEERPINIAKRVHAMAKMYGSKIGILGVAYKKNVDDCRETPVLKIIKYLLDSGLNVRCHDPHVLKKSFEYQLYPIEELANWADFYVLTTDHDYYKDFLPNKPIFDTRNFYKKNG